jgi:hypothetical protein
LNKIPPVPRFTIAQIRAIADSFRQQTFGDLIPIDVMDAIEFDLGMEVRPVAGLEGSCGMDALIMSDLDIIYVDQHQFMDERYDNRLRFSLAHELGHRVLHGEFYSALEIKELQDTYQFFKELPEESYKALELHAHEFAGRLLVPPARLIQEARALIDPEKAKLQDLGIEPSAIVDQASHRLARLFGVSESAMNRRLIKEQVIDHIIWD